ncbi:thiosulfate oxidation carrier complex protein SoxZ [Polynucleobacter sp. es-GGE-1]|jgi:sulfur-oxidizing protein SoxZ|uniref:thiosulfate oxidation carrier complex protein SoxZ n=1 Tax=unclassified Polynucleobacter TaxID=2640945 RepID=UPI001BFDEAFD|nr:MULTISPECIES: thiosulfate oxidation carrier complex protein SoxZ [unclassified Polynucleobacter]MBU3633075.1 thiosulfate oxidation carrier complex protein SoxZ [Polynucleobacter sp. AP-Feld-500C-C5]MBU3635843.1 thiosulfate oxidation carrier complex protein SoxZ [Polynucleobacter sp. es-GGE-1]MEA9599169.1 thiosulfate oxidation carrier complex protein SoxZ [Polynucleobacter sp. AP-Sanab-80-C2]QWD71198.1 thiosulfate oxidation carrier complex protein SoxZ [Polynucleobacter sp. UB-Siik-W21]QWE07
MSKTSRTSISMPSSAKKGSIIEIRAIAQHDMESGFRYTEGGKLIPRDIIRVFTCTYNNVEVFKADFYSGIGANPLIIFTTLATETGTLEFKWTGDDGYEAVNQANLTVT